MLHDFGTIVFTEFKAEEFEHALAESSINKSSLYLAETKYLGMSHAQVSQILSLKWGLSEVIAESIACHHQNVPNNLLSSCIFTANQIAKQAQLGNSGNPVIEILSAEKIAIFGVPFNELIEELGDISLIKETVHHFIGT